MEEEKNMIKGQEGEAFVIREVGKVANYLGKYNEDSSEYEAGSNARFCERSI